MKCPFGDGWEGTPDEYLKHYDEKHSRKVSPITEMVFGKGLWKTKFSEDFAHEIMVRTLGRSRFGTDEEGLEKRIRKMLDQYEKEWG